jgi:putative tricarboxylic transport membrane protein
MRPLAPWIACLAAAWLSGAAAAQAWKPVDPVEIVVGAGPGGGNDNTARTLQKLFQEARLVPVPINVVNRTGAGGAIALTYLNQHTGKGNYLGLTSNTLLTNHITGRSPLSQAHFTPLAVLINEYLVFSVKPDSPLASAKDLVAQLKKDPGSVVVGISSSLGNINHIGFATAARAVGVDPKKVKTVAFKSSSESITALLGGHIDLVVGPASIAARFLESRQMRVLAITSPARQAGVFATVPTWKETGVNAVIDNWRGVIGVKGLSPAQVAYWDATFSKLFALNDWKQDVATNYWDNAALTSREAARYMDRQYDFLKRTLIDLDMVKGASQ